MSAREEQQRLDDAEFALKRYGLGVDELRGFVNGAAYGREQARSRASVTVADVLLDMLERERYSVRSIAVVALVVLLACWASGLVLWPLMLGVAYLVTLVVRCFQQGFWLAGAAVSVAVIAALHAVHLVGLKVTRGGSRG